MLQFPATIAVAEAVKKIKANTSGWMADEIGKFSWQEGYGAFSVSKSNMAAVQSYVQNQEKHHRRMTFEDEFIALLKSMESTMTLDMFSANLPRLRRCVQHCTISQGSRAGLTSERAYGACVVSKILIGRA